MRRHRRTKIVATLGPASRSPERIAVLMAAGVDVFRLNFSHGSHEDHAETIQRIRAASRELKKPVAIMQDLQGPKIRVGELVGGQVDLVPGATFRLTSEVVEGTAERVHVSLEGFAQDVPPGSVVLIDDGRMELVVTAQEGDDLICRVVVGGMLKPHKGVNFPGVRLRVASLTPKDREDAAFGVKHGVDLVAISFVQLASDVLEVKDYLHSYGARTPVVAKIERQEALNNLKEIVACSDAIMVARGDLGVETPAEQVPLAQKRIIRTCNAMAKPVITATQMLDSMISNPRPTRAEASDVANAILDGTDAVMLSNETAVGEYPVEAVQTMARIALQTEPELAKRFAAALEAAEDRTISQAISHATCQIAYSLKARAIITATHSGSTARQVASFRPTCEIFAATPIESTQRELMLVWGVHPLLVDMAHDTDTMVESVVQAASRANLLSEGDTVVISAGVPMGVPGTTNLVKIETVSTLLATGQGLGQKVATGRAFVARTPQEALGGLEFGDVLILDAFDREWTEALNKAAALVLEEGGLTSPGAIAGMALGVPVIVGVAQATRVIPHGQVITLDPKRGVIYAGSPSNL